MILDGTAGQAALLVGLLVVVLAQVIHRLIGAALGIVWCLAALAWGVAGFAGGAEVAFLGIPARPWHFVVFLGLLAAYNLFVCVRLIRRRAGERSTATARAGAASAPADGGPPASP